MRDSSTPRRPQSSAEFLENPSSQKHLSAWYQLSIKGGFLEKITREKYEYLLEERQFFCNRNEPIHGILK